MLQWKVLQFFHLMLEIQNREQLSSSKERKVHLSSKKKQAEIYLQTCRAIQCEYITQ